MEKKYSRREFLGKSGKMLAAAGLINSATLGGLASVSQAADANSGQQMKTYDLRAAFGKVKITPEEEMVLAPYSNTNIVDPKEGILDDLYARVAVFQLDNTTLLFVNLDMCLTNQRSLPENAKSQWARAAGTTTISTVIFSTHTHSAPIFLFGKYADRVTEEIKRVVGRLEPVHLRLAKGECSIAVNRRPWLKPNFKLPADRGMDVLLFEDRKGKLLGSIVQAAVHGTVLWNTVDRVSSEVMGLAMQRWEAQERENFAALFLQGFSGDIGPLGGGPEGGETGDTYHLVKTFGRKLYYDIMESITKTVPVNTVPLSIENKSLYVPVAGGAQNIIMLVGIRMGELAIYSTSLEVFNEYRKVFLEGSPFKHTVCTSLCNHYSSYLPTPRAYRDGLGGYEMKTSPYSDSVPETFQKESLELLKRLHT
ncbi:hypothetical protein [Paenibacillus koleovorans]|uniref:hypothetical protein n=1 Tax=Paenibacillus koleovorans TaxID=121608 RepID=UPI000FDB279E|nr:hypothetical protein [Paenibacillus koleovorans]